MKKLGLLLMATLAFAVANAQKQDPTCKYLLSPKYYQANWFITAGAGANVLFGSADGEGDFSARVSPQFELYAGKWFTDIFGLRAGITGYQLRGYQNQTNIGDSYIGGQTNESGLYHQKFNYWNPHVDVLFNFSAAVCRKQRHVYEAIPYLGIGYTYSFMHTWSSGPKHHGFSVNAGLINAFHVTNEIDLNLNLNAAGVSKHFDKERSDKAFKGIASITFGATWKL